MVHRKFILFLLLISLLAAGASPPAFAEESYSLSDLLDLGKKAFYEHDYRKALFYFHLAHLAQPQAKEPLNYVNLVHRAQEGRVLVLESDRAVVVASPPEKKQEADQLIPVKSAARQAAIEKALAALSKGASSAESSANISAKSFTPIPMKPQGKPSAKNDLTLAEELVLDDQLWARQPDTRLQLDMHQSVILRGNRIEKFLVITPGFITIERMDQDRIKVNAAARGSTIIHVWDDRGRWTFNLDVVFLAAQQELQSLPEELTVESYRPFKFDYSNDWSSYYTGNSFDTLDRRSLTFIQRVALAGPTPYGYFDSFGTFTKFAETTEATGYGVGLTDGRIGDFQDFSIRGFDVSRRFSDLSMPGKYLRGVLFSAKAFDHNISYDIIWGKDRSIFSYLTSGSSPLRESFIEGTRVTLFPESAHRYSVNLARGYGPARETFLKERVFSFDTQHELTERLKVGGELAYDDEEYGKLITTRWGDDRLNLSVNARDIDRNYVTIAGIPGDQGEAGGNVILNWNTPGAELNSNLDVYRDRKLFNPAEPDSANLDWNGSLSVPLNERLDLRTSLYYVDTPQLLSPRRNAKVDNILTKRFPIPGGRTLTAFVGQSYQKSRFSLSPISEFDRLSATAGLNVPLIRNLSYFLNYEYSWVDEKLTGTRFNPNVVNTGFGYTRQISDSLSGNMGLTYRNEEQSEELHSFLAGEDSVSANLGLSFHPTNDFEFFVDGRLRDVWRENASRAAYNEGEINFGVRTSWETPFSWNPKGVVEGTVFKDLNSDAHKDPNEPGIPGIKVMVGKKELVTDARGKYRREIRASKVTVGLETDSIPPAHVASTPLIEKLEIIQGKARTLNFGLSTHSGIFGIVFLDANHNGSPDEGELRIPKVRILMDAEAVAVSDFEGSYRFDGIASGKHVVRIDVNSLSLEYLPVVKIRNEVDVTEGTTYVLHVPVGKKTGP